MAVETLTRVYVRPNRIEIERDRIQFVTLGATRIGLRTRFVAFDSRWRLFVLDLDGAQIAGPRVLVPGVDLLRGSKHDPRVPPGELFVYSTDGAAPDFDTMDVSCFLYYRPEVTT